MFRYDSFSHFSPAHFPIFAWLFRDDSFSMFWPGCLQVTQHQFAPLSLGASKSRGLFAVGARLESSASCRPALAMPPYHAAVTPCFTGVTVVRGAALRGGGRTMLNSVLHHVWKVFHHESL